MTIGIIDSGLGGAVLTSRLKKTFPHNEFIFVADVKNFPYGTKSHLQLNEIVLGLAKQILSKHIRCLVIACNTATASALIDIKRIADIPIIDPISLVLDTLKSNNFSRIGVLATKATIESNIYQAKIAQITDVDVVPFPNLHLAQYIEDKFSKGQEIDTDYIRDISKQINDSSLDSIILGCTHYCVIKEEIKLYLKDDIEIIDTTTLMFSKIKKMIEEKIIKTNQTKDNKMEIFITKESKDFANSISKLFSNLEYSIEVV